VEEARTPTVEAVERCGVEVATGELVHGAFHAGCSNWRRMVGLADSIASGSAVVRPNPCRTRQHRATERWDDSGALLDLEANRERERGGKRGRAPSLPLPGACLVTSRVRLRRGGGSGRGRVGLARLVGWWVVCTGRRLVAWWAVSRLGPGWSSGHHRACH
jgi:hypothetical protein